MKKEDLKIGQLVIAGGYIAIVTKTDPATVFLGNGLRQEVEVKNLDAVGFKTGGNVATGGPADFGELMGHHVFVQVLDYLRIAYERHEPGNLALPVKDVISTVIAYMEGSQWTVPTQAKEIMDGV